jgi:putative spermidine/putrescine transport system ATP-binding protein
MGQAESQEDGSDCVLNFVDVRKDFGEDGSALRGMNLEIQAGEFLTLLGPSGGGKSTALMMLAGFDKPTSGDILYKGQSISIIPAHRRNFGVVFQTRALFPHLTALQNVAYPLRMRGVGRSEANKRAREALARVHLSPLVGKRPARLAAGEQQRVALARIMVFEPDVIIMDEPLASLDMDLAIRMEEEIRQIHENLGNTVVYATQDHTEAIALSDRIAIINAGAVQQTGTPEALYEEPQNAYTARFMGETNMLHGTVTSHDDKTCQVTLDTGEEVTATAINVSGSGARTRLSVRPERLIFNPDELRVPNRYKAKIDGMDFRGDHTLVHLRLPSGTQLEAKIPNGQAEDGFGSSDDVEVGWHAAHCRALDPPPSAPSGS